MASSHEASRRIRQGPLVLSAMLRASDGLLDLLPIATFICDVNGVILQYNSRAVEFWGCTPQPGETHESFSGPARFLQMDGTPMERSLLTQVLETGVPVRDMERIVRASDGATRVVSVSIDPLRNARGELVGAVNCFIDITERKRADAALADLRQREREHEQRLAATYEHAAIGIAEVAPDGRFLRVNEAICAITGRSREELLASRLFAFTHPNDRDSDREGFEQQVVGTLEFYSIEKRMVRKDGRIVWVSVRSSPVRSADGRMLYVVRVVQDITDRKAAEQRQKLLIDELNHRVKNTLATVQSLATQTARGAPDPNDFRQRFEGRLIALSKAHDQLTAHHWESADLRGLVTATVAPYAGGAGSDRIVLRGQNLVLRPRAVLTLAMVLHEMTTNAAKYGALSASTGRLEIEWQKIDAEGGAVLRIDWTERGGPPVKVPESRGFGSRMIEGGIASELNGTTAMTFAPEGLQCRIVVPLDVTQV